MVNDEELAEQVTELATWLDENVDTTHPEWAYDAAYTAIDWVKRDSSYDHRLHFDYLLLGVLFGGGVVATVVFFIAAWARVI